MTNGMLGGKIGPMVADATVMAAAYSAGYPWSSMDLISIFPKEALSAMAEPEIPAKTTLATTLACPNAPGMLPTMALAKRKIRSVTPE